MKKSLVPLSLVLVAGLFTLVPSPARSESQSGNDKKRDKAVAVKIPESLKAEHEELHAELDRAIKAGERRVKLPRRLPRSCTVTSRRRKNTLCRLSGSCPRSRKGSLSRKRKR